MLRKLSAPHLHDVCGAGHGAFLALDAVGVQIAFGRSATVVGSELHGAYAGAALTLHLAAAIYVYVLKGLSPTLLGRYPRRDGAHRAERTPGARRKDKGHDDAHQRCGHNDVPEHAARGVPVAPRAVHLPAEHGEDKAHHEQAEAL